MPNVDSFNTLYATGIRCFVDDEMHALPGAQDHTRQGLYHFTVGGAVDNQRPCTFPPPRFSLGAITLCRWARLTHGSRDRDTLQHGHRTEPFNDFHLCCVTHEERSGKPQSIH